MDKKNKNPEVRFKSFMEDWEVKSAENLCSISTGKSNTQDRVAEGKYPFYVRSLTIEKSERYLFDEEAVLTVGDGVGTGKVYHYVNGKYDLHQRVYRMYDFKGLSAKFFFYYFSNNFHKRVLAMTAKTSVDSVRLEMISKMDIIYPILANEQIAISSFFQNLDNHITLHQKKYDKLIVLKKVMLVKMFPKDGAFVPEIRFKGFTEDWKHKILGKIGQTYTGLSGKTKVDFGHGKGRFVTYMNVFNNPISNFKATDVIEIDNSQNEVNYGDVFFTTSSETPEEVGMSSVWLSNEKNIYLNSFCFGYRLNDKLDNYFLSNLLRSSVFRKKISFLAQGISRYNISKTKVMEISIEIPSYDEQQKIGQYFQNLDKQIALHQTQLNKLKNIKKACFTKMFVSQD